MQPARKFGHVRSHLNLHQTLPKKIWMYWDSGPESSPELVKQCVESWRRLNPEYIVHFLSDQTVMDFIVPGAGLKGFETLPIQKRANFIRKQLIIHFGGIWVDSTVMCLRPLSQWLPPVPPLGFIVLRNYSADRLLCNWFIAGTKGNPFLQEWLTSTYIYFSQVKLQKPPRGYRVLHAVLLALTKRGGLAVRFWTSRFGTSYPIFPSFIDHYLAGEILRKDHRFTDAIKTGSVFEGSWGRGSFSPNHLRDGVAFLDALVAKNRPPLIKLNHRPGSHARQIVDPVAAQIWGWLDMCQR